MSITRRRFISALGSGIVGLPLLLNKGRLRAFPAPDKPYIKEASYYQKLDHQKVRCLLCPNQCIIPPDKRGHCEVRENQNGILKTLVYGRLCSLNNDPIEKKPLFHFLPGTNAISVATAGCNVDCKFCQNWNISQARPEEIRHRFITSAELVDLAHKYNSPTIAYTYNEPTVFYEYVYDTAVLGKRKGIKSVHISNGYINKAPLQKLCQVVDAIKVDFKAYSPEFYRRIVNGRLQPVLDTLIEIKKQGVWLEMVYLIIPTHNDNPDSLKAMCQWIIKNLGKDVPIHFTRFHPQYLMKNLPSTPLKTLEMAYNIAQESGIHYVYIGNVPGSEGEDTFCPECNEKIIGRRGYFIQENHIENGKCGYCGHAIAGVWKK